MACRRLRLQRRLCFVRRFEFCPELIEVAIDPGSAALEHASAVFCDGAMALIKFAIRDLRLSILAFDGWLSSRLFMAPRTAHTAKT